MTPGFLHACEKRVNRARRLCAGFAPDLPPDVLQRAAEAIYRTVEASATSEESASEIILALARPDLFYSPGELERLLRGWMAEEVSTDASGVPARALDIFLETLLAQLLVERSSLGEPGAQRARTAPPRFPAPEAAAPAPPDRSATSSPDTPPDASPGRAAGDLPAAPGAPDDPRDRRIRPGWGSERDGARRHSQVAP